MNGALSIAVIHHLSTFERRLAAVTEMARVIRTGGRLMIYVWAYEQPNGKFTSQDVLVPWHMHEIPCKSLHTNYSQTLSYIILVGGGENPRIAFHRDSTKEQRIIAGSISVSPPRSSSIDCDSTRSNRFINIELIHQIKAKFIRLITLVRRRIPPALPQLMHDSVLSAINELNPTIGNISIDNIYLRLFR